MSRWDPRALPRGRGQVVLRCTDGGAELVLDNPTARNAISVGMMVDLAEAIAALSAMPALSCVVVRGEGRAFCAGGDLRAVRRHLLDPAAGEGMCQHMTGVLDALAALPVVVIAAVEGAALGGGAELLTACDLVVAASDARIGFVHAALGVSPGWGGGRRLVARVGARQALPILCFAQRMSAEQGKQRGVVDEVVPPGQALAVARARQAQLTALPPEAVRAAARIARGEPEAPLFKALWGGAAHRQALAAVSTGRT